MKKIVLALVLLVSVVSVKAQEKVLLRLNYQKGDNYLVKVNTKQEMGTMMNMDINMDMNIHVTDIAEDVYITDVNFKHAKMDMNAQGTSMSYDSNDKVEDMNVFAQGVHSKMKPLLESMLIFKYDKLGNVKEVNIKSGTTNVNEFKDNTNTIAYPEEAVTVGSNWKGQKKTTQGVTMNYEYKVVTIDTKKVTLELTGTITELGSGDIKGKAFIDRATGNISQMNMNMNMNVMGQAIKSTINMTTEKI